jgi:hypothetical protein
MEKMVAVVYQIKKTVLRFYSWKDDSCGPADGKMIAVVQQMVR